MKRLESHPCTEEELSLIEGDADNATFMPLSKNSLPTVRQYKKKFFCVDKEALTLNGDFAS